MVSPIFSVRPSTVKLATAQVKKNALATGEKICSCDEDERRGERRSVGQQGVQTVSKNKDGEL